MTRKSPGVGRREARTKIVQAANRHLVLSSQKRRPYIPAQLLSHNQIQRAVRVARHNKLVDSQTLEWAGFHG